ncbi:protein translocase subunit SecF [Halovulum sp. GXIMD14794]
MMHSQIEGPLSPASPYPFSRWRVFGFSVSLAMLALGIGMLALRGLNLGLDFTGGTLIETRGAVPWDLAELRAALGAAGLPDAVIQLSEGGREVFIRLAEEGASATESVRRAIGPGATILSEASVGPKVSGDLLRSGLLASFSAVAAIGVYVWLRFEARFGLSAFLTTLHDVAMMVCFFAITGLPFDLTSIAALLMIAGYSINDTVVVFDRMREVIRRHRTMPLELVIDTAVTDTLRRTLMTSGTTIVAALSLLIFGGPVLFGFAAAVTFGVLLGTFSSIFVAAPLLLHLPGPLPGQELPDPVEPVL